MDASYSILLDALRTMELRIGEAIDRRGATCALRAVAYASDRTTIFDREPFRVDIDDAPVFDADTDDLVVEPVFDEEMFIDTEPDSSDLGDEPVYDTDFDDLNEEPRVDTESRPNHVVVAVLKFKPEYDAELAVFDDGPIFDEEPFVDPIFDAAPDSDHAAVTVLNIANSLDFNIFHKGLGDTSAARTGVVLDENPLFDEEPGLKEVELITTAKEFVLSTNIAAMTTTMDAPFACSTKFRNRTDNTTALGNSSLARRYHRVTVGRALQELAEIKGTRILVLIDKGSNTYCSSDGDCGGLFHDDLRLFIPVPEVITTSKVGTRSVISASVETYGIEHKFWDPGVAEGLEFMPLGASDCSRYARFDVDFGSGAAFLWDPGSLESLQSIGFANFHLAHPHELHVDKFESKLWDPGLAEGSQFIELTGIGSDFQILLLQQKYGGTADMWVIALGYMCRECQFKTWKFSFLEEIAQVDSFSVSGNVEFLQSGLDHHVPPCAQWQSSICYGCSAVGSHSKTDLIGALLLQWDWHIRALVAVTSKVHMPWGFSWLATPDDSYTVGYNIVLEMLIGGIQSVTLGDGPRAHSLLLSAHDQKMAEFLELQAQDGIGLQGISFLDQSLSVKVVAGAAADDGLSLADVTTEAKHSSDFVGSIGVALFVCTWPGRLTYDHLGLKQMELGLGIHGEPGGEDGADYLANLFLNAGFQNGVIVIFMEAEEHIDEFEVFDVQPFVSRLLGMGDWPGKHIPPSHALDHNRALGQISEPTAFSGHEAHVQELVWIPLMNLLVSGSWDKTLRFPDPSCNAAVGQDMVNLMADDEDKEKYAQYLRRPYIEDNRKTSWCPAPGCKYAVAFIMSSGSYDVNCNCSYGFCLNCSEEALSSFAYDPSPCKWYEFDYNISALEGKRSEQADQGEKHICSDEEYKVGSRNWAKPNDGQADWHPIDDILHWHNANRKELHDVVEETRRAAVWRFF